MIHTLTAIVAVECGSEYQTKHDLAFRSGLPLLCQPNVTSDNLE